MTLAKGGGAVSPSKIQDGTKANKVSLNSGSNKIEFTTNNVLNATLDSAGTLSLGTSSGAEGIEVIRSSASTDFGLKLRNNSNGDIKVTLETAAQAYSVGIDNSVNDYLKLSTSSTDVGSNTLWTIKPDGKLGLLTVPTSTLHVAGSIAQTITTLTSATTLNDTHSLVHVDATTGTVNISLPTSVGISGRSYIVMKTDSSVNTVVIDANATETISGDLTLTLTGQYDWVTLRSDGANWVTEGSNNLEMASICLDSGTISALPLNFCTDPNTGLYNPGADSLSLVTGGTSRLTIVNDQVGIATTTPQANYKLDVNGSFNAISSNTSFVGDGLYGGTALPSKITYPNGMELKFGYTSNGDGQYYPRIGTLVGTAKTSFGTAQSDGNAFTINTGTSNIERVRVNSTGLDLASGLTYKINSVDVLSSTALGSSVVGSSLTSVGTLSSLNVTGLTGLGGNAFSGAKLTVSDGTSTAFKFIVSSSSSTLQSRDHLDNAYTPSIYDATYHAFKVSGTEAVRIDNGGALFLTRNTDPNSIVLSRTSATARNWALGIDGDGGFRLTDTISGVVGLSSLPSGLTFLASQGELAFKYNSNTEGMRLSSTGNLGIGNVANRGARLDVSGNIFQSGGTQFQITNSPSSTGFQIVGADGALNIIGTMGSNEPLAIRTGAIERMRIDSIGLGIGVTPSSKLHVNGSSRFDDIAQFYHTNGTTRMGYIANQFIAQGSGNTTDLYIVADVNLRFGTGGAEERMRIDSTGNLGIGESFPLAKLHVKQGVSGVSSISSNANTLILEGSTAQGLTFSSPNTSFSTIAFADPQSNSAGQIEFNHPDDNMSLKIQGVSKINISPSSVNFNTIATINTSFQSLTSGTSTLSLASTDTADINKGGTIQFVGSYNGTTQTIFAQIAGLKENITANNYAGYLGFYTRTNGDGLGVERMRLSSTGNLGIGVTPTTKLDVNGSTRFGDGSVGYISTTSDGHRLNFSRADVSHINAVNAAGFLGFGTGGNDQQMTILANGNVGIGSTNPARKLDVAGSGQFISNGVQSTIWSEISSGVGGVGTNSNHPFAIATNGSEKVRVDATGNVGIGSTNPAAKLHIDYASSGGNIRVDGGTGTETGFLAYSGIIPVEYLNSFGNVSIKAGGTSRLYINRDTGQCTIGSGNLFQYFPAPTTKSAAATLTISELLTSTIETSGTSYTLTLPTGTSIEGGISFPVENTAFGFCVINSASGTITLAVNTGVTSSGNLTVATGISAQFKLRRTAANNYIVYRVN